MHSRTLAELIAGLGAGLVATACQSYSRAPVDLEAHARLFAERGPDPVLLAGGLDLQEARLVALLFNPELRALRLRAGVARASADHAGLWADPVLSADFARILESVDHPWIAGGSVGLTLPITGRLGLEVDLAESRHAQALVEARLAEAHALDTLDSAWARWSAARLAAGALEDHVQRLADLEAIAARLAAAQELTQVEARTFTLAKVSRQAQLVHANATAAAAEIEIKQVLGLPPDRPLALVPGLAVALRVGSPGERRARLSESPRVALQKREHDVAERHLALAVRKQWPELTLLPGFREEDAQPRAALGFSLPLPLWNKNAREIAEARALRDVAAETLRGSLERATQDLARAEVRREAALAQRSLIETQLLPLAEQQVADGKRLAELGKLDTLLVLDALTRSYEAKALAIDSALAEAEATIETNALSWPSLTAGEPAEAGR